MRKNIGFKISLILVIILLATALLAPVLAPNDPNVTNIMLSEAKPNADYPLGNDNLGRCMLSRVLYGARTSVFSS